MHMTATVQPIVYPESDGKPMADNDRQFSWIVTIASNLRGVYADSEDVFVGGNLLWYPVEGDSTTCAAPDVFVVFGRTKWHRPCYKQWEEDGIPLTVVFEILSPSNDLFEMADKLAFYDEYGVMEYFAYDPERNALRIYQRGRAALRQVRFKDTFVSPKLGIRFDLSGPELVLYRADGTRFLTSEEIEIERRSATLRTEQAEQGRKEAEQRAGRMADLMRKVLQHQATAEEQAELQGLLQADAP